ncbi:hypothetical protein V7968_16445 [Nocardia vulneris]|uniref:hypothetical protein n=1 Tax=Nocardia vulneris TaxID=1141657 RepID=UPI0030CE8309
MNNITRSTIIIGIISSLIASGVYAAAESVLSDRNHGWLVAGLLVAVSLSIAGGVYFTQPTFVEPVEEYTRKNLDILRKEVAKGSTGRIRSTRFTAWSPSWQPGERLEIRRAFRVQMDLAASNGTDFYRIHSLQTESDLQALRGEIERYAGQAKTSVAYLLDIDSRLLPELFISGNEGSIAFPRPEGGLTAEMGGGYRYRNRRDVEYLQRYYDLIWSSATVVLASGRVIGSALDSLDEWAQMKGYVSSS